jgi:CspA family cold shock protein
LKGETFMTGIVKRFNANRGFGFITPLIGKPNEVADVYFHVSSMRRRNTGAPPVGAEVRFKLVRGNEGPQAAEIELTGISSKALTGAQ